MQPGPAIQREVFSALWEKHRDGNISIPELFQLIERIPPEQSPLLLETPAAQLLSLEDPQGWQSFEQEVARYRVMRNVDLPFGSGEFPRKFETSVRMIALRFERGNIEHITIRGNVSIVGAKIQIGTFNKNDPIIIIGFSAVNGGVAFYLSKESPIWQSGEGYVPQHIRLSLHPNRGDPQVEVFVQVAIG